MHCLIRVYSDCGSEGRGFALPRLQLRYAPGVATLILGVVWALWHLPLVFVDPSYLHGFTSLTPLIVLALLTLVGISLMAFFYTWVYNATQSVLPCRSMHGSFNTVTEFVPAHRGINHVPFSWSLLEYVAGRFWCKSVRIPKGHRGRGKGG